METITDLDTQIEFFRQINADTTIITPNRRLSATLHKMYQEYQLTQEKFLWQTPDILPISSWMQRLWRDYTSNDFKNHPLLLNTAQEQFLWEQILTAAKESALLLQISETADIAKSAWGLLKQWCVDMSHPLFKSADDYHALHDWASEFKKIGADKNYIDACSLADIIAEKIAKKDIMPPKKLLLVGFTELSPQIKRFLHVCEQHDCILTAAKISAHAATCQRISLLDSEKEIVTIARWAKDIYAKNNSALIGCVIPSLDKIRDRVMQIFSEVFDDENDNFNISAGKNLLQYPIINTALQSLSLYKKNISTELFSYLLASPYLGDGEKERIKRAHFDSALRQNNVTNIQPAAISQQTDDKKRLSLANNCPLLARRLQHLTDLLAQQQKTLSYSKWASVFNDMLSILGWPGERSLSSDEYQVVENWLNLLTEFVTLDQIAKPVTIHQALQTLYKMASKRTFQPKSPEAPIQVLGILEAAGIPFDYLWVAGMDDLSWPPQPKPNPFIPKKLQRELQMPHATAERELHFCQQITKQFNECAKYIIYSHAEKNEALELQTSPLIRHITPITLDDLKLTPYQTPSERIFHSRKIETLVDEEAGFIKPNEKIRGGTDIIKQQALCPFKSFATHRLHARELDDRLPGLRPKERGTIVHKTLELVWNQLQDQATLNTLDEQQLNDIIVSCIETAMDSMQLFHQSYTKYIALEKSRLHSLILDWLHIEKTRAPFKVANNEKAAQITLNQLPLTIRIDRIDELADGNKLIIDYKTGKNNQINSWFSTRPEEPQLPLYALLEPSGTAGITFAQVTSGDSCFKGISHSSLDIDGVKLVSEIKLTTAKSWDEQLEQWRSTLTKLSDDFYQGYAQVDPKNAAETCMWCALKPLCRINEAI